MSVKKNKFELGDVLKHFKGGRYLVTALPNPKSILEESREPFYSYMDKDFTVWHRKVSGMESDGRFVKIGNVNTVKLDD